MLSRLIAHVRHQWMGALALFLVLTGGVAYAANTVFSSDIANNEVYSADVRDDTLADGGLGQVDLKASSVRSSEVGVESLTGADIANQSGVDTCTHGTTRFGELCVRVLNGARAWFNSIPSCTGLSLRLPSLGEARVLASQFDLPNLEEPEFFWTEEIWNDGTTISAWGVSDDGNSSTFPWNTLIRTVCVTTPTN